MKGGKTSTVMQLAKKSVCVFPWIYSGKNAYALFGQPNKRARIFCTTKKSHFASVKRAILKKWKNQKCRTGHGEKGALLRWWAGCKLPTATLEKCTVCPETSKKLSLQSIGHFHSWAYILWKPNIDRTQAPQCLGLLCLPEPRLGYPLNIPGKRKMDKEVVVLMYNGILLSH